MYWTRTAMLLALPVATVAIVGTLDCASDVATKGRLACYVALANDLGPLVEPGLPDMAAEGTVCEQAPASTNASPHFAIPRSVETGASRVGTN